MNTEWRYEGDDFVMDNLYSGWLIRQDQTSCGISIGHGRKRKRALQK